MNDQPLFRIGDTARTITYVSPLPRGTTVAIVELAERRRGFEYLVEGLVRGRAIQIWMKEADLGRPFI